MAECVVCGEEIPKRKKYCEVHRPKSIFEDPAKYGTYEGPPGNDREWRQAFQDRFTPEEIREFLGDQSPWEVLCVPPNADEYAIKAAYRRLSMQHHPDKGGDRDMFQRIKAARDALLKA